ncbi:multidrug DMT transporter permease [Burkholderia lata]|nr:multidrug DMT transporter permease [Burkholderia lata]
MNALQLVTLAAIRGASFLVMRMGTPDFGVVPLIALRAASNASPERTMPPARVPIGHGTRLAFWPVRDKE